jgi:simple sugar transport system permease protein
MGSGLKTVVQPIFMALAGVFLGVLIAAIVGENPINILSIMVSGVFGTPYDLGTAIYYMTILLFTGLAVAVPYRSGLFNIGAEGQLVIGGLCAAIFALTFDHIVPSSMKLISVFAVSFLGGAAWGGIAGWIRAYRGGHEVISTIMLNFVAAGLSAWLTLNLFKSTDTQIPETSMIDSSWMWPKIGNFDGAPVTLLTVIGLLIGVAVWFLMKRMNFGYLVSATAESEVAAEISGIETKFIRLLAMMIGGGFAGMAGGVMVLASTGRFRLDMGEGFGFAGIPVALLGKGDPIGVILSAGLFAFLQHGASALDLEATYVNRDFAQVIQALVVLIVVSEKLFSRVYWKKIIFKLLPQAKG